MNETVNIGGKNVRVAFILALLIIAGAGIRFFNLTYTGLWLDEIYSMSATNEDKHLHDIYESSKLDQPPVFFVILKGWRALFGYHDFAGRSLACVLGVLGILAIYFLGKEFKSKEVGLFASFLTTISWFHVGISVEIRFYALLFLLATLSYLFFLRCVKYSRIIDFTGYCISTALTLNTHYFGMVLFATQVICFIVVLCVYRRDLKFILGSLIAGALAGLSFLHWLPVILHDLQITKFHIKPITARYVMRFPWWYFYDPLVFAVSIILLLLVFKRLTRQFVRKTLEVSEVILLTWFIVGFAIPFAYSLLRMPLITNKYCTIQVPALFLLVACGSMEVRHARLRAIIPVAMLCSAVFVLFFARPQYKKSFHEDGRELLAIYGTMNEADTKTWNEDWREVAGYFTRGSSDSRAIFSQLAYFHKYYFDKNHLPAPQDQNEVDVTKLVSEKDEIWLLMHDYYTGGWPHNGFLPDQRKLITSQFILTDSVRFTKSTAYCYRRKERTVLNRVTASGIGK